MLKRIPFLDKFAENTPKYEPVKNIIPFVRLARNTNSLLCKRIAKTTIIGDFPLHTSQPYITNVPACNNNRKPKYFHRRSSTVSRQRPEKHKPMKTSAVPLKRLLSIIKPKLEIDEPKSDSINNYQRINRNSERFDLVRCQSTEHCGSRNNKRIFNNLCKNQFIDTQVQTEFSTNNICKASIKPQDVGKVMLMKKMELLTNNSAKTYRPPVLFRFERRAIFTNDLLRAGGLISPKVSEKENTECDNYGYSIADVIVKKKKNSICYMPDGEQDDSPIKRLVPKYL